MQQHNEMLDKACNDESARLENEVRELGEKKPNATMQDVEACVSESVILVSTEAIVFTGPKGKCLNMRRQWQDRITKNFTEEMKKEFTEKGHIQTVDVLNQFAKIEKAYTIANVQYVAKPKDKAGG